MAPCADAVVCTNSAPASRIPTIGKAATARRPQDWRPCQVQVTSRGCSVPFSSSDGSHDSFSSFGDRYPGGPSGAGRDRFGAACTSCDREGGGGDLEGAIEGLLAGGQDSKRRQPGDQGIDDGSGQEAPGRRGQVPTADQQGGDDGTRARPGDGPGHRRPRLAADA